MISIVSKYLQFVAASRRDEEAKHVNHVRHDVLGLADPHRLHNDVVVTTRLTKRDGFVCGPSHATQVTTVGTRTDICLQIQ